MATPKRRGVKCRGLRAYNPPCAACVFYSECSQAPGTTGFTTYYRTAVAALSQPQMNKSTCLQWQSNHQSNHRTRWKACAVVGESAKEGRDIKSTARTTQLLHSSSTLSKTWHSKSIPSPYKRKDPQFKVLQSDMQKNTSIKWSAHID